jgi:hypothetical protein
LSDNYVLLRLIVAGKINPMLGLPTRRSRPLEQRPGAWNDPVTVRMASARDGAEITLLAERDTRPVPPAPRLVAERAGRIEAVLSLTTGAAVADPFRPTADLVELLRWARP